MENFNRVSMIGLGYIGLPTAAILASRNIEVIGVDIDQNAVETINSGGVHIVEADLDALVSKVVREKKLSANTRPQPADAFIIAVPTPFKDGFCPDLKYVEAATRSIAPVLRKGNLVILESTSPVGTTQQISEWLATSRTDLTFPHQVGIQADIQIAYCPERVLPGKILKELIENDRVIGGLTPRCAERAQQLYKIFVEGDCIISNARTAEMVKLTENSFRDVNIAFANELSVICDKLDINVWELVELANRHPRVNILQPGPGVGGHCIAVDPWFIVHSTPKEARLIKTARHVNDDKPRFVIQKVREQIQALGKTTYVVTFLGLSYKADTDDLRESPSMKIVESMGREPVQGCRLTVVEPHIKELPTILTTLGIKLMDLQAAIEQADIVVLLVNHRSFSQIDPQILKGKRIVDTRGTWS